MTISPPVRKVLLTGANATIRPVLDYTGPTHQQFADANGYEVVVADFDRHGHTAIRESRMAKVSHIRDQLTACADLVMWVDADALFLRSDGDPADDLRPTDFQGFVLEVVPQHRRIHPNTGVWVIRNTPLAFDFLDCVIQIGYRPDEMWTDQAAVMRGLDWDLGDRNFVGARMGSGNEFTAATAWLNPSYNMVFADARPRLAHRLANPMVSNPHVLHLAGMSNDERLEILAAMQRETIETVA